MDPVLDVRDLEIKYHVREGTLTAVRNLNFTVGAGEIVGIVGESGCGKSTVASAIMRLLPPNGEISAGQMLFKGRDLCRLSQEEMRDIRGKDISMIFQDPLTSLNPVFRIKEQMLDAQRAHQSNANTKELLERAVRMLERVGIPDAADRIEDYPHQFSGGMRQRIMIAIALLANPALLIADEPTSALDVTLEAQILELIRGLRDELGTSILYITHDLGVVAQLCDRVIVMYAGNLVEAGDVFHIFQSPKHPYTRALLRSHPSHSLRAERLRTIRGRVPSLRDLPPGCKFAPRCDYATQTCHLVEPGYLTIDGQVILCHSYHLEPAEEPVELIPESPTRRAVVQQMTERAREQDEVVVETRNLHTYFYDTAGLLAQLLGRQAGAVRAVDGVDLQVQRGETLALVGESGSGKTTLGRTILRLERPTDGQIIVEGQDITHWPQSKIRPLRARMQMIFQDPISSLSPRMKVSSILLEPFRIHHVPVEDPEQKVDELLEMVGLSSEQADKYPHQLSGGQARRVGIARALALRPDLLVADEPTAGLDVSVAAGILNLLKDLREQLNLTYIIITHNLNVIGFIANRVAVMYLGRVVELAPTELLFTMPKHPYTEALMSAIAVPDPSLRDKRRRIILQGEIPSPRNPPPGCLFHPRCPYAEKRCSEEVPLLRPVAGSAHLAACHFPERVRGGAVFI